MIKTGLVSVTFRSLKPEEVILLTVRAGLDAIEWGGDIHVPHGDLARARSVKQMTFDAGIKVASYGSYYKAGCEVGNFPSFESVLETAVELNAPTIRVWAGNRASSNSDEDWFRKVAEDTNRIASLAEKAGITISYECHANTLTDTVESASRLIQEVNHPNLRTYWQPSLMKEADQRLAFLKQMVPWLTNVHVYFWKGHDRLPLSDGEIEWLRYLEEVKRIAGEHFCMLEFVKDDLPEQFLQDAATLREWVGT